MKSEAMKELLAQNIKLRKENEELKKDFVPLDFDPLECYSCGEPIKKDKEDRIECYCNDCEPMDREDLKQQNSKLKEESDAYWADAKYQQERGDIYKDKYRKLKQTKERYALKLGKRTKELWDLKDKIRELNYMDDIDRLKAMIKEE